LAALEEKEMLNFHPGFWKSYIFEGNAYVRHIDADGKVKLKALDVGSIDPPIKEFSTHPYRMILVKFVDDFKNGQGVKVYQKGLKYLIPAYSVLAMINAENNRRIGKVVKLAFDVALTLAGVAELRAALALASSLNKTVKVTKAVLDLGFGIGDILIQEALADKLGETVAGQKFLDLWNSVQLLYGIASLTTDFTIAAKSLKTNWQSMKNDPVEMARFDAPEVAAMEQEVAEALRLAEVARVLGAEVPAALRLKLGESGVATLKSWTGSRDLKFKSIGGSTYLSNDAERQIFVELEQAIANGVVTESVIDRQGRLIVRLDGSGNGGIKTVYLEQNIDDGIYALQKTTNYVDNVGRQTWNGFTNIFKANADEILEATNRIKNHRLTSPSGGNYGYLEGTVNNVQVDNKFWRSGAVQEGEPQIFTAIQVEGSNGGTWLRNTDSEYKMLNKLANDLGGTPNTVKANINGELKIISENPYCASCTGIIQQFHDMFPNLKLILVDGAK
jgi:hypothetical protein